MSTAPRWGRSTKQLVSAALLVLAALLLYGFRTILIPIILVLLLSYILAPVVGWLAKNLRIGRSWAVALVYLVGLAILATLPAVTIPAIVAEVENLLRNLEDIVQSAVAWVEAWNQYEIEFMGYVLSLPEFEPPTLSFDMQRVIDLLDSTISPLAGGVFSVVRTVASGVAWLLFMAATGFYLLRDADRFAPAVLRVVPSAYRGEATRLLRIFSLTWNAFLRGQIVLCLVIGAVTATAMSALGIRFALALGIIAGILEVIPTFGPILASVPAILIALFQGSSWIPISNVGMALIVAGIYWMIQNLENNLLVPRIIGHSLNLHPLVVIVGVLAGVTLGSTVSPLGGVLGALLAAPILATFRHVLRYTYAKLFDLDPFPEPRAFVDTVRDRDVRAILFDLDGTLIDSDDMLVEDWAQKLDRVPLLRRLYKPERVARRLVMSVGGPTNWLIGLLDTIGIEGRFFALGEWARAASCHAEPAQSTPVDGTVRFVKELSASYDLAITTTRSHADALKFVDQLDLGGCFKAVITRDDVKRLKPHPETIRRAAEALGHAPEQCIVVGDTTVDIKAGKRAGALTVGVLCGFAERPELERWEPDLVIETTVQLGQHLPCDDQPWCENW